MKKLTILTGIIVLWIFVSSHTFARENPRQIAEDFIAKHEQVNLGWKNLHPIIVGEQVFYTYNNSEPSYVEYKVSCDETKDCGFVLVNLDQSDTKIPISSLNGQTISEKLRIKWNNNAKYYYFNILSAYSFDENTKDIKAWNPEDQALEEEHKNSIKNKSWTSALLEKFNTLKEEAVSLQNKRLKKQINQQNSFSTEISSVNTRSSGTVTWNWINQGGCRSYTPCYEQFWRYYGNNGFWWSGCSPTAFSIIMGYYDRNGFPNILRNAIAPVFLNEDIRTMQTVLGILMWTRLSWDQGMTEISSHPNWWRYIDNKYNYSSDYYSMWTLTDNIQDEIRAGRPVVVSIVIRNGSAGHSIVAHGFSGNDFYVNFWWWSDSANVIISTEGNDFEGNSESGWIRRLDTVTLWSAI